MGMPSNETHRIRLGDGRRVAFATYGKPDGSPIIYFHGTPGNRVNPHLEQWGRELGLWFVAPDRPGFGASSFSPRRTLLGLAADIRELAEHLSLTRFAVVGISGGGPPALACAR